MISRQLYRTAVIAFFLGYFINPFAFAQEKKPTEIQLLTERLLDAETKVAQLTIELEKVRRIAAAYDSLINQMLQERVDGVRRDLDSRYEALFKDIVKTLGGDWEKGDRYDREKKVLIKGEKK